MEECSIINVLIQEPILSFYSAYNFFSKTSEHYLLNGILFEMELLYIDFYEEKGEVYINMEEILFTFLVKNVNIKKYLNAKPKRIHFVNGLERKDYFMKAKDFFNHIDNVIEVEVLPNGPMSLTTFKIITDILSKFKTLQFLTFEKLEKHCFFKCLLGI